MIFFKFRSTLDFNEFLLLINRMALTKNIQTIRIVSSLLNGPSCLNECNKVEPAVINMDAIKFKREFLSQKNFQDLRISVKSLQILNCDFLNQSNKREFKIEDISRELFLSNDFDKIVFESIL